MTDKKIQEITNQYIKEFQNKHNATVIYVTVSGSKLYGTDTPDSDTDLKGIFIPDINDVLLKKDLKVYTRDTNNTKEKNSSEDIDFTLHSIYQFMDLIQKSETGTVDLFFSMFSNHNIVFENKKYTNILKDSKDIFMNKNMKSFIGYALGQTKKFGIKGARYNELSELVTFLKVLSNEGKLEFYKEIINDFIKEKNFKYIKFIMADGPKNAKGNIQIEYLSVLSKLFSDSLTMEYFKERVQELFNQFGNRTKTIAKTKNKTDWKSASHSLRIAEETKELLETGHINFPLKNAQHIKDIKEGNAIFENVIDEVEQTLAEVDNLLETTDLLEESNKEKIDELLLNIIEGNIQ